MPLDQTPFISGTRSNQYSADDLNTAARVASRLSALSGRDIIKSSSGFVRAPERPPYRYVQLGNSVLKPNGLTWWDWQEIHWNNETLQWDAVIGSFGGTTIETGPAIETNGNHAQYGDRVALYGLEGSLFYYFTSKKLNNSGFVSFTSVSVLTNLCPTFSDDGYGEQYLSDAQYNKSTINLNTERILSYHLTPNILAPYTLALYHAPFCMSYLFPREYFFMHESVILNKS